MNNAVFGKNMEENCLVSESNYHATNIFTENLLATEIKKAQVLIIKPFYLGLSILDLSKSVLHKIWYDYIKRKYGKKQSCVIWIQTDALSM